MLGGGVGLAILDVSRPRPLPPRLLVCIADRTASLLQKCCSFCGTEGLKNTLLKVPLR